jgi:hypothetical protein
MSKFVRRTEDGNIGLVVPVFYEGFAEEELQDNDPELVAFLKAMEDADK